MPLDVTPVRAKAALQRPVLQFAVEPVHGPAIMPVLVINHLQPFVDDVDLFLELLHLGLGGLRGDAFVHDLQFVLEECFSLHQKQADEFDPYKIPDEDPLLLRYALPFELFLAQSLRRLPFSVSLELFFFASECGLERTNEHAS